MGIGSLSSASSRFTCGQLSRLWCRPREAEEPSGSGPPPAAPAVATAEAAPVPTCAAGCSRLSAPLSDGIIHPAPVPRRQKPGNGEGEEGRESGCARAKAGCGDPAAARQTHGTPPTARKTNRSLSQADPAQLTLIRPRAARPLVGTAVTQQEMPSSCPSPCHGPTQLCKGIAGSQEFLIGRRSRPFPAPSLGQNSLLWSLKNCCLRLARVCRDLEGQRPPAAEGRGHCRGMLQS